MFSKSTLRSALRLPPTFPLPSAVIHPSLAAGISLEDGNPHPAVVHIVTYSFSTPPTLFAFVHTPCAVVTRSCFLTDISHVSYTTLSSDFGHSPHI